MREQLCLFSPGNKDSLDLFFSPTGYIHLITLIYLAFLCLGARTSTWKSYSTTSR